MFAYTKLTNWALLFALYVYVQPVTCVPHVHTQARLDAFSICLLIFRFILQIFFPDVIEVHIREWMMVFRRITYVNDHHVFCEEMHLLAISIGVQSSNPVSLMELHSRINGLLRDFSLKIPYVKEELWCLCLLVRLYIQITILHAKTYNFANWFSDSRESGRTIKWNKKLLYNQLTFDMYTQRKKRDG